MLEGEESICLPSISSPRSVRATHNADRFKQGKIAMLESPNNLVDASGGSVFRNLLGAVEGF
jgi:hypothetical protein